MATEGEIIQQLIKNKGYGQGKFADKIGIARPTLNSFIKGKKPIGKVNYARIAEGLDLSYGVFIYLTKLDIPLDQFKSLQEIAELKPGETMNIINALLKIKKAQAENNFPSESLPLLSHLIEALLKVAESLDK